MIASIVQPPSKVPAATRHTGFQSALNCRSLALWPSLRAPSALVSNWKPFRRSWKVSKPKPTESPWRMLLLSRRSSLATRRPGWLSHALKLTYRLSSSNDTQTSVFSVASTPACGSIWMKCEAGRTLL